MKRIKALCGNEQGVALVTVLLLVATLTILGTTVVIQTSTDLKIASNFETGREAFYAAEAGIEEGRARLRKYATGAIGDGHPTSTQWRAYIGTDVKAQGKGYDSENVMHVKTSSLQSTLDYVVVIQHQTDDSGNILYWGDADGDGTSERSTTPGQNIYLINSYGTFGTSVKTITAEVTRVPPITVPSALYVEDDTSISGTSTYVSGNNACGATGDKPGIKTTDSEADDPITPNGNPTIEGNPAIEYSGTDLDIQSMVNSVKDASDFSYTVDSVTHTADTVPGPGDGWGTPTSGATQNDPSSCSTGSIVHYDTQGTSVKLSGGTSGCGILVVEGDLELSGAFSWYGIIIATGSIRFTGGGPGDKNVTGGILSGASVDADMDTTISGGVSIIYCSTAVENQTQNAPLKMLSWREDLMP